MKQDEKPLKILMLEDNMDDIHFMERLLTKNGLQYQSVHVDTREEFIDAMRGFQPDIVLSDHGLPQFNSREALKICMREKPATPFIIVTGTMSDEFAISCLQDGADDYLLKSNLSRLPSAIRRAVKERRLERLKREARHALRRQNGELIKVNSELDKFVYSVSHNIRGPVASVLGLINVAKLEDTDKKLNTTLAMIENSLLGLDETLREILDFLRNERSELSTQEIDWEQIISKAISKVQHLANFNEITIDRAIDCHSPFYSDPKRITAALINILSNAVIFSDPKKKRSIRISVISADNRTNVTVADNGIGIQREYLPKVSNMFFRASEVSKGAGLGLYITREIIKKLNGAIEISSQEGTGTEVFISIPNSDHASVQQPAFLTMHSA